MNMDIKEMIKKKDNLNMKIRLLEKENNKRKQEKEQLAEKLLEKGIDISKEKDIEKLIIKLEKEVNNQLIALEKEVEKAEEILGEV